MCLKVVVHQHFVKHLHFTKHIWVERIPLSPQQKGQHLVVLFCCVCEPGSHVLSVASLCESVPSGRARIPLSPLRI